MPLVFGHMRLDLGQFPHLMPQRLGVVARELRATTSAFGRFEWLHVVALVGGNQRSFVFLVAGLPAAFFLRLAFRRLRLGVRMLRAGRQRGVLRRLAFRLPFQRLDPCFQFRNVRQQARMIAWASGGWRVMISSVIPGGIPLLLPNAALRVQVSLSKIAPQGVNGYIASRNMSRSPSKRQAQLAKCQRGP